ASADAVGRELSSRLGMPVEVRVPADYSASVEALVSSRADVAYVSSLPFLLARRDGQAQVLLAEERQDAGGAFRTEYDSLIVVPKDSPLQSLEDLVKAAGETRFCFTSPTSTSGFIFPMKALVGEGLLKPGQKPEEVFKEVSYGGGYSQALQQVVDGRADAASVSFYTMEGDSADTYLPAADRERLRVLARIRGVPTHVVAVRSGLSEDFRERLKAALLDLAKAQPDLLEDVYGTARLVEVDEDRHVQAAADAVKAAGLPLEGLAK
ncbi:MAG: phosphate/phosphite/phosphonate ABC transporter substrate-binding protein, partial [Fimbriimonadaceae bacterium]|nr:phosphate/phosphite/phosphonate ABC transporter substrate-binding protein [Fimbriimonadaceae bacterium]